MAVEPKTVTCPPQLWRVGRSADPLHFSHIDPIDATLPRSGNRFDVPGGGVLYAATTQEGAFAETLARYRPTATMRALRVHEDEHLMAAGAVPADWRDRRQLVRFALEDPLSVAPRAARMLGDIRRHPNRHCPGTHNRCGARRPDIRRVGIRPDYPLGRTSSGVVRSVGCCAANLSSPQRAAVDFRRVR